MSSPFHFIYHHERSCWCTLQLRGQILSSCFSSTLFSSLFLLFLPTPILHAPPKRTEERYYCSVNFMSYLFFLSEGVADLCGVTVLDYMAAQGTPILLLSHRKGYPSLLPLQHGCPDFCNLKHCNAQFFPFL
jgi:hypothetical protein